MSSYYPSFNYMGLNSFKDKNLVVASFDVDQGECDTFLGMESIYTNNYDGTRRLDYGARHNNVALVKIAVIKANRSEFTVAEVRDFLKWTTGARKVSYLDLLVEDEIKCSFLGRVINAYQQKLDARTIGLAIEFESVSPWAYSPLQTISCTFGDVLHADDQGVVYKGSYETPSLSVSKNGTLNNGTAGMNEGGGTFTIDSDGAIYIDNTIYVRIDNNTDDLYSFVDMNAIFKNANCTCISINNTTIGEVSSINNIYHNEVVTLSSGQFITSDRQYRTFGNSFNYIWPRLKPGINNIMITGDGVGEITFTYRYPIKIGDCAIDVGTFDNEYAYDNNTDYGFVHWSDIVGEPTTLAGYGITDTYTAAEIDAKLANIEVGGGGSSGGSDCDCDITINENDLNAMLTEILQ